LSKFARHFFVCTNQRPVEGRPSCGTRGGPELLTALQTALAAHPEVWAEVAVTAAGCLGPCFDGPTMVVYPEGAWYVGVQLADVTQIVDEHLVGGRAVARLLYQWPAAD
jgi:(2Fe-2S) ferredoxin